MKYFSMFSGIGGFEAGIENAYGSEDKESEGNQTREEGQGLLTKKGERVSAEKRRPCKYVTEQFNQRPFCVGYSEIDRYATAIYRRHYPEHRNYGDATAITPQSLPDFDLLVAGFPCQAFSIAGKRQGFMDARGTLFFEIARVLDYKRPGYFLLENVEGLLSHDDRRTFVSILRVLTDLGYRVQWQVLNSKDYGLAQNRERVFIVGSLGDRPRPKVFPIAETNEQLGGLEYADAIMSETNQRWLDNGKDLSRNFPQGQRVYKSSGLAANLSANSGGLGHKTGLYAIAPTIRAEHHNTADVHFIAQALQTDGYLRQGTSFGTDNPQSSRNIRRLTPTECERLQGFPDGWTEYGIDENAKEIKISNSQRYRCLGNAVSANVITAIMRKWMSSP